MRNLLAVPVLFALLLIPTGCATTPENVTRVASASKIAAYVGTAAALQQKPAWRPGFVTAVAELKALEASETIDFVTLLAIVNRLPIKELKSPEAVLIISGATLVLQEYGGQLVDIGQIEKIRPIVTAIRQGVELGLGPTL